MQPKSFLRLPEATSTLEDLASAGVSPAHLLLRLRMECACGLLEQPGMTVKRVAAQSGFGSEYNLRRAFVAQLGVNALWSWLFFAWHKGAFAFVDVLVLLALIAATVTGFWRIRRLAGVLLIPYFAWVAFASALTWAVWQRNPTLL